MEEMRGRCLGLVRESYNVWERRTPLTPRHVQKLVSEGVRVLVQPSERRVFPIQEYLDAGAEEKEDLSEASLILGVKQVPINELVPERTYSFFSHTIKAQPDNMPLLDALLEKGIALVDYEMLTTAEGMKVAGTFGNWAGRVGMLDILSGLGVRLLALGFNTPFLYVSQAHNYRSLADAQASVERVGEDIGSSLLPAGLGPLIFAFIGYGSVSQGAQEILKLLPHEFVTVDQLSSLVNSDARDKVFACVCREEDHLVQKDGKPFQMDDYLAHPENYDSLFPSKVGEYVSILVNGIVWHPNQPRLLTNQDTNRLLLPLSPEDATPGVGVRPHRLLAICDISADPGGSLEFMKRCTTMDRPFFVHRPNPPPPQFLKDTESLDVPDGVLVCSVDNMPAQMAKEASENFADLLFPILPELVKLDVKGQLDETEVRESIKDAVLTWAGELTPKYQYIQQLREDRDDQQ